MFTNALPENRAVYETSKLVTETEGSLAIKLMRVACWISVIHAPKHTPCARASTHTQARTCNTYCFSMTTVVS